MVGRDCIVCGQGLQFSEITISDERTYPIETLKHQATKNGYKKKTRKRVENLLKQNWFSIEDRKKKISLQNGTSV